MVYLRLLVTPPNTLCSINISQNGDTLRLLNTFAKTDIDISAKSVSQTVSLINAVSGWTATINADFEDNYAKVLYPGTYHCDVDNDNEILLYGAQNRLSASQVARNLFQTNSECSEAVAIYQGGYATIPDDLKDALIRITIQSYNTRQATNGALKSESIGDYSYTTASAQDEMALLAINYKSLLDMYRINIDI